MPSPFPCSPVIRECSWNKTHIEKKIRSVETGLRRWTLVVAVIDVDVDAYPYLTFSDLSCLFEDTGLGVLWLHLSKKTKLWSRNQEEASPSAGENNGVVLAPCHAWKCVPTTISDGVDIIEVLGCYLLRKMTS